MSSPKLTELLHLCCEWDDSDHFCYCRL